MNGQRAAADPNEGDSPVVTPEIAAEAAVWIARLHGPDRSVQMERECLDWQKRSAAHRLAFERCTDTWEDVSLVTLVDAFASARRLSPERDGLSSGGGRPRWAAALAVGIFLAVGALFLQLWRTAGVYSTGVGEQQIVILEDGTRLSLNTHSRVRVDIDAARRRVRVEGGEALFEVAKDPRRPFVVQAAGSEIVAIGTVFSVRLDAGSPHDGDSLSVLLIEGKVTLQATRKDHSDSLAPDTTVSMQPGERVRLSRTSESSPATNVQKDRPRIESLVAWKRSEAIFDNTSLSEAVAEVNRYDRTPIVLVGSASLGDVRVSGVYRTGDAASFARDVAALHGLVLRERPGRLELAIPQ